MKKFWGYICLALCVLLFTGCSASDVINAAGQIAEEVIEQEQASAAEERQQAQEQEQQQQEDQEDQNQEDQDQEDQADVEETNTTDDEESLDPDGHYTSKEDVALYLHLYGELPENFITKRDAEDLGWDSREGNLQEVAPGMSIGGSRFGNYENQLPDGNYKECDINYEGGYRGSERIIYSDEGDIYYTGDHYKTFEKLY